MQERQGESQNPTHYPQESCCQPVLGGKSREAGDGDGPATGRGATTAGRAPGPAQNFLPVLRTRRKSPAAAGASGGPSEPCFPRMPARSPTAQTVCQCTCDYSMTTLQVCYLFVCTSMPCRRRNSLVWRTIMEVGGPWAPFSRNSLERPFFAFTVSGRTSVRARNHTQMWLLGRSPAILCSSSKYKSSHALETFLCSASPPIR